MPRRPSHLDERPGAAVQQSVLQLNVAAAHTLQPGTRIQWASKAGRVEFTDQERTANRRELLDRQADATLNIQRTASMPRHLPTGATSPCGGSSPLLS